MTNLERAFLESVTYAALFDYPLSLGQLQESLLGVEADEHALARCYARSEWLRARVGHAEGWYYPRGRSVLVAVRRQREAASRRLLQELSRPLALITRLPFVRLVALSGSLAHLNADEQADLDLFLVTRPGRVWSVTLTALVLARLMGWRQRLCLNYVVSEAAMMVSPADLFTANQILHLRPISGAATYTAFLAANRFVERFYPNFHARTLPTGQASARDRWRGVVEHVLDWTVAAAAERACRFVYGRHLRRRASSWRSRDQVQLAAECLKLHTTSHRREVMARFERAIEDALRPIEPATVTREGWSPLQAAR